MEDIQQYHYTPLLEPDAFRVIVIHPALSIESSLSCSLIHSTLFHYDQSLIDHYIALSYVWGDANNRKIILVDQKPLLITASLASALRYLRDKKTDIAVWADGICINQFDIEEKNKQVSLMSLIYEVARHTVIFLGETTSETDEIFKLLDSPMSSMTKQTKPGFLSNVRKSNTTDQTFNLHSGGYIKSKIDDLIRQVIDMPWFRRIWILQELILSGDPWVQVGFHRLRWQDFTRLILDSKHNSALVKSPNYNVLNDMHMLREISAAETLDSFGPCDYLLKILHSRRGHGVFNPRDMLYGHLALFANRTKSDNLEIEKLVEIDYQKSIADVYTDLTLYILNRQCDFKFLSHVEDVEFEEKKFNLPTWVPDWTSKGIFRDGEWHSWRTKSRSRIHDISDIHVVLGEKAVLGCIGTRVGSVEMIKNDIPKRKDVFALCHEIKNFPGGESSRHHPVDTYKGILELVCRYFCAWFNTSETSPYNLISEDMAKILEDAYSSATESFLQRMELVSKIADPADLEPLRDYSGMLEVEGHPTTLWMYVLMGMTDVNGNFLAGKKLAALGNGKIALVSVRAEVGDEIWRFNGEEEGLYYVLRGYDGEEGDKRIEKNKREGEKDGRAEMDRRIEEFFERKKKEVMVKYVDCGDDGRLLWRERIFKASRCFSVFRNRDYLWMANSLLRAARVLANLGDEGNNDGGGKRNRKKELEENLKRKMETVVGNLLNEMTRFPDLYPAKQSDIRNEEVILLKTDVGRVWTGTGTGGVNHVRYVGECILGPELRDGEIGMGRGTAYHKRQQDYDKRDRELFENIEKMREWWKLGLGVPSESLDEEGEYENGWLEDGLEEWRKWTGNYPPDEGFYADDPEYAKDIARVQRRVFDMKDWKKFTQPLRYEILAIH
ncbi:uncharacterized protein EAE98_009436 [Botrytis deweyae]|uniref:Heterokaryon incompatibility domain-containing protein n=1 Tax=Botrytis deweyae TaxID=2478750 RepID=A0ABQ7IBD6_9HELO|nr:uncharacterized protein EAE98_009436 [Botrytis deweyae]KAF7919116.1 hypothetical protein EAE98_009436 [Botrytis deweyae]